MIERYPLHWPTHKKRTPAGERKRAQFSSKGSSRYSRPLTIAEATKRLMREIKGFTKPGHIWRIDPDEVIISTNLKYRLDGLPYSNQKEPGDVGVAVYFNLDGKDYCMPCDKWDRIADNIAAIAAHLGAMRGIERWGVGELHDIYTGYKALPQETQSYQSVWETLGLTAKPASVEIVKRAFRNRSMEWHPDKPGGSHDAFTRLQSAYQTALTFFQ